MPMFDADNADVDDNNKTVVYSILNILYTNILINYNNNFHLVRFHPSVDISSTPRARDSQCDLKAKAGAATAAMLLHSLCCDACVKQCGGTTHHFFLTITPRIIPD